MVHFNNDMVAGIILKIKMARSIYKKNYKYNTVTKQELRQIQLYKKKNYNV